MTTTPLLSTGCHVAVALLAGTAPSSPLAAHNADAVDARRSSVNRHCSAHGDATTVLFDGDGVQATRTVTAVVELHAVTFDTAPQRSVDTVAV